MADTYRKVYAPLTEQQKAYVQEIKTKAEELETIIDNAFENGQSDARLTKVAKTQLEIAIMVAVKAVTVDKSGATNATPDSTPASTSDTTTETPQE